MTRTDGSSPGCGDNSDGNDAGEEGSKSAMLEHVAPAHRMIDQPSGERNNPGHTGEPPPVDPGVIDISCIDSIRSLQRPGRPDILAKVVACYFNDGDSLVAAIREGFAAGDAVAVQRTAHRLKSSSAFLGASRLADYCQELEELCSGGKLPADNSLVTLIERGYRQARSGLEPFRGEQP